jgi:hypothetical protein
MIQHDAHHYIGTYTEHCSTASDQCIVHACPVYHECSLTILIVPHYNTSRLVHALMQHCCSTQLMSKVSVSHGLVNELVLILAAVAIIRLECALQADNPHAKAVFALRNPVERAWSDFR